MEYLERERPGKTLDMILLKSCRGLYFNKNINFMTLIISKIINITQFEIFLQLCAGRTGQLVNFDLKILIILKSNTIDYTPNKALILGV